MFRAYGTQSLLMISQRIEIRCYHIGRGYASTNPFNSQTGN